jgi:hypothetical protein
MAAIPALAFLLCLALPGVLVLGRITDRLTWPERLAYGPVLGVVVGSLVLLASALALGELSRAAVIAVAAAGLAAAGVLRPRQRPAVSWNRVREEFGGFSVAVLGGSAVLWGLLIARLLYRDGAGDLSAGLSNVWADWALHLGDVTSFAYGDNFPVDNPRFSGEALPYHYLTSLTAAAMVKLGMTPWGALVLHSFVMGMCLILALWAFARRVTGSRDAAGVATGLVLFGGGLGWTLTAREAFEGDPWDVLRHRVWNSTDQNNHDFRWYNQVTSQLEPQRGYLYGLPIGLLVLTLLILAISAWGLRLFVAAGAVGGTLPLAHGSTLLALALLIPVLALLARDTSLRRWVTCWAAFFATWILVSLPQIATQHGGGAGPLESIRWETGWIAGTGGDWLWFWIKNLGLFLPLVVLALVRRDLLPGNGRLVVLAAMPIFVLCNLIAFLPWDWDNTKPLFWWFLATCLAVAALITDWWRRRRSALIRVGIAVGAATMVLSGVLVQFGQLTDQDRNVMLTAADLSIAEQVRATTPPTAVFATDFRHNNPISVLAGRRVVTGYDGWLFSEGINYFQRQQDVRQVYALGPDFQAVIDRYGIDFVVIGPGETATFAPDAAAFRARFPVVARAPGFEVFRVR